MVIEKGKRVGGAAALVQNTGIKPFPGFESYSPDAGESQW